MHITSLTTCQEICRSRIKQGLFIVVVLGIMLSMSLHIHDYIESNNQKDHEKNLKDEIKSLRSATSSIANDIGRLLVDTNENPNEIWHQIRMIEVAPWFGGEGIDYIYLLFKADMGIITGKVKINGMEIIYPFSTQVNTTLPLAIKNKWVPERGHFQKLPTIEYLISEKSTFSATLSIIMSHAHGVGEASVINIENPVEMIKSK